MAAFVEVLGKDIIFLLILNDTLLGAKSQGKNAGCIMVCYGTLLPCLPTNAGTVEAAWRYFRKGLGRMIAELFLGDWMGFVLMTIVPSLDDCSLFAVFV